MDLGGNLKRGGCRCVARRRACRRRETRHAVDHGGYSLGAVGDNVDNIDRSMAYLSPVDYTRYGGKIVGNGHTETIGDFSEGAVLYVEGQGTNWQLLRRMGWRG